jgi:histidinol-phosphate aminotransferase
MKLIEPIDAIKKLREYKVVSQEVWYVKDHSRLMKLDWNEATVSSPRVRKAVQSFLAKGLLHWYPDVASRELNLMIAKYCNIHENEVLTFDGSDTALETVLRVYADHRSTIAWVVPSYDQFRVFAQALGGELISIMPDSLQKIKIDEIIEKALNAHPRILYIVNPNNPIGYLFPVADVEALVVALPETLVLVDEAYIEFSGGSCVELIHRYPNIAVFRSFSKAFGMAGLRLGYVVSDHRNLIEINKLRNGKNVSMLAQVAAIEQLRHIEDVHSYVKEVIAGRELFVSELKSLGIQYFDSRANFVLVKCQKPQELVLALQREGIFVRDRSFLPGLNNTVRFTIGTKEQMKKVINVLKRKALHFFCT